MCKQWNEQNKSLAAHFECLNRGSLVPQSSLDASRQAFEYEASRPVHAHAEKREKKEKERYAKPLISVSLLAEQVGEGKALLQLQIATPDLKLFL